MLNKLTKYEYILSFDGKSWTTNNMTLTGPIFEGLRANNGYTLVGPNASDLRYWYFEPLEVTVDETSSSQINNLNAYYLFLVNPITSTWLKPFPRIQIGTGTWEAAGFRPLGTLDLRFGGALACSSLRLSKPGVQHWYGFANGVLTEQFSFRVTTQSLSNFTDGISWITMDIKFVEYIIPANFNDDGLIYFVK